MLDFANFLNRLNQIGVIFAIDALVVGLEPWETKSDPNKLPIKLQPALQRLIFYSKLFTVISWCSISLMVIYTCIDSTIVLLFAIILLYTVIIGVTAILLFGFLYQGIYKGKDNFLDESNDFKNRVDSFRKTKVKKILDDL